MRRGQHGTGIVENVEFPNKGIVRAEDGTKVIVKNVIPGQKVSFAVNKARHGKAEGRLLETLEKSPLETEEACPHFGICGGCTYQTVPYQTQLEWKLNQVKKLISDAIGSEEEAGYKWLGIKESPRKSEYRNKMEFTFGDEYKGGPLALGMHKKGSFYDLVTVENCQIVDEDFRTIIRVTRDYFTEAGIPYFHRLTHIGYLRHLLVRKAVRTGEILVDLVTTTQIENLPTGTGEKLLAGYAEALQAAELKGTLKGILHTVNDSVADVIKNEGTEILYGEEYFYEELLGLRFRISPFSFFQTNSLGAEVLYSTARDFILNGDEHSLNEKTVYDLYSGTGTIAQMMAPVCKEVVGVEIVEEAVEAAKENALLNGLDNCTFLAGDVLKALDEIEQKPDYIILDPPRDGIHPKALEKIIAYGVDHMVYISCKPSSLARDLEVLTARGYKVEKICCVDMFPNTVHVETVVLLSKGEISSRNIRVEFSLEDMDITSLRGKATYDQIKGYIEERFGMKVSTLYISQIKRKCGLEVGESYNKPKSEDSKVPVCPPEKEVAIMDALKHFGMI